MTIIKRICVFCGSGSGKGEKYIEAAKEFARELAAANIGLIYGGAKVGLMGVLADTVLQMGGEVIGVMPKLLVEREVAHLGITDLHIVNSMHERKALMANLADAFVMLPGSVGSFDEFFEILTWRKLNIHQKPYGILNVDNYYDHLLTFLDHTVEENFMTEAHRNEIIVENNSKKLLDALVVNNVVERTLCSRPAT